MSHPCAIPHCSTVIPDLLLMCGTHWKRVPRPLQAEVYRTYRAWGQALDRAPAADSTVLALRAYRAAREAAIEAVIA